MPNQVSGEEKLLQSVVNPQLNGTYNRTGPTQLYDEYWKYVNAAQIVSEPLLTIPVREYEHLRQCEAMYAGALMEIRRLNEQVCDLINPPRLQGKCLIDNNDLFDTPRVA